MDRPVTPSRFANPVSAIGGWIAAEMAVRGGNRLGKLVLIDALGIKLGGPTTRDIADFHNTNLAELEAFIGKPIKLQTEPMYTQTQYDVVLM